MRQRASHPPTGSPHLDAAGGSRGRRQSLVARSCASGPQEEWIRMKSTRILLADSGGVRGLSHVVRNLSTGPCTVRSAAPTEALSRWHPDFVLMDPGPMEGRTRTSA